MFENTGVLGFFRLLCPHKPVNKPPVPTSTLDATTVKVACFIGGVFSVIAIGCVLQRSRARQVDGSEIGSNLSASRNSGFSTQRSAVLGVPLEFNSSPFVLGYPPAANSLLHGQHVQQNSDRDPLRPPVDVVVRFEGDHSLSPSPNRLLDEEGRQQNSLPVPFPEFPGAHVLENFELLSDSSSDRSLRGSQSSSLE